MAELTTMIGTLPDGARRSQLEEWYWAMAADRDGALAAHWHRQEYWWLRTRWRRLQAMKTRPALGAFQGRRP